MKTFFAVISVLSLLFNTILLAQQSPRVNPYDGSGKGSNGTVSQPMIVVSSTAYSSTDYAVYPSSNSQSEMSIAISPAEPNRLWLGQIQLTRQEQTSIKVTIIRQMVAQFGQGVIYF